MKRLLLLVYLTFGLVAPAAAQPAKDTLTIDTPNDAATLDPHLQWDNDSYGVYRNIFDNLLTRDASGKIVPQIATAWHNMVFGLSGFIVLTDIKPMGCRGLP